MLYAKIKFALVLIICLSGIGKVKAQPEYYDYIKPFVISREITRDTPEHILKIITIHHMNLKDYYHDDKGQLILDDIESIKYLGTYKVKGMEPDSVLFFKLEFKFGYRHLPMSFGQFTKLFVVNNNSHKWYLVDLNTLEPIKTDADDDTFYFAGRHKRRTGFGWFNIYKFKDGVLTQIFRSSQHVSNYSLNCMSYENDDLKLENVDVNGDGYLDLKFSGIANYYCVGGETYNRDDKKPIKTKQISFVYLFDNDKQTWVLDRKNSRFP